MLVTLGSHWYGQLHSFLFMKNETLKPMARWREQVREGTQNRAGKEWTYTREVVMGGQRSVEKASSEDD